MIWHFTVNGIPACESDATLHPHLDPPTVCSYSCRDKCAADAARVKALHPGSEVEVRSGHCKRTVWQ